MAILDLSIVFFLLLLFLLCDFFLQQTAVLVSLGLEFVLYAPVLAVLLLQLLDSFAFQALNLLFCEYILDGEFCAPIRRSFRTSFLGNLPDQVYF